MAATLDYCIKEEPLDDNTLREAHDARALCETLKDHDENESQDEDEGYENKYEGEADDEADSGPAQHARHSGFTQRRRSKAWSE